MSQISAAAVASASQTVEGKVELATQAEMETGTDTKRAAAIGNLKHLRLVAKLWVKFNSAGTIISDEGVVSVTDNGIGDWTINFSTPFSNTTYVFIAMNFDAAFINRNIHGTVQATGTTRVNCEASGAASDTTSIMALAFGDQ